MNYYCHLHLIQCVLMLLAHTSHIFTISTLSHLGIQETIYHLFHFILCHLAEDKWTTLHKTRLKQVIPTTKSMVHVQQEYSQSFTATRFIHLIITHDITLVFPPGSKLLQSHFTPHGPYEHPCKATTSALSTLHWLEWVHFRLAPFILQLCHIQWCMYNCSYLDIFQTR